MDVIFGDTLDTTVAWIIREAVEKNTADGYREAYWQLRGIDRWHITMRTKNGSSWGLRDSLALMNEAGRMLTAAESPELRARIAAEVS